MKVLLAIVALLVAAALGLAILNIGPVPEVQIEGGSGVGKRTPIAIQISEPRRGLSSVKVELVQGDRVQTLAERSYTPRPDYVFWGPKTERDRLRIELGREVQPDLKAGDAILRVHTGRAGTWLRHPDTSVTEKALQVRFTPPALQLVSSQVYVAQGGSEVVVYRVGETSVRDGVRAGEWWFPGMPLPGGDKQARFALCAVPYDMNAPKVQLVAADELGNEASMAFVDKFFPKPFKNDRIELSDAFMNKVVPEIRSQAPELPDRGDLLQNYLTINGDLRRANARELKEMAAKSRREFLWSKPFLMMPNGKVMSSFADRRTYRYQAKDVDRQDHLGFDLAVTRRAPVPAANSGVVTLARYFGIYGNAVVIDHGYGLMSLYGHLATIQVATGQQLARGDIIGLTGETGLAGGDHLHFTMLLHGLPVNPIEWWDGHWIRDRIARKLGPAFKFEE